MLNTFLFIQRTEQVLIELDISAIEKYVIIIINGNHLEDLVTRMKKVLNLLYIWLQANTLSLNGQKTNYILFHRAINKLTSHTSDLYMGDSI